jgi:hypothetical protein
VLTPEQRRRAEAATVQALEQRVGPARGDREKLRKLLAIPASVPSRTERYMSDSLIDAFGDPAFVPQLVANMSDTQVSQAQNHPVLVMEIAGEAMGNSVSLGFRSLTQQEQRELLRLIGEVFVAATPAECDGILGRGG